MEKQQVQPPSYTPQQQQVNTSSSSSQYPGVVGATPECQRGVQGYDAYGQPIRPAFMEERYRIEQSLGPACPEGGYHELRMHYTNTTLLFAILIIPYLCGWRGRRYCVCKRCGQKFPNIVLPEP
ncbi:hypothetical protein K492DRAFT_32171 [Lichtheimia hyalospora FSU 10163]|nr:hypothetical protein K492DRAFT_32171 [Lichtheimia hyalospora FSU 10163]